MHRCVNCGIATGFRNILGHRALNDETILSVIRQWRAPQSVNNSDHVCQACWDLAQRAPLGGPRHLGHRSVCLRCGRSLASRVSHQLHTGSPRELRIYNVIQEWIMPAVIEVASCICHMCWVAADRAAVRMVAGPSTSSQASSSEDSSDDNDEENEQSSVCHDEEPEVEVELPAVKVEPGDIEVDMEQAQTDPISLDVKTEPRADDVDNEQAQTDPISLDVKTEPRADDVDNEQAQTDPISLDVKTEPRADDVDNEQAQTDPISLHVKTEPRADDVDKSPPTHLTSTPATHSRRRRRRRREPLMSREAARRALVRSTQMHAEAAVRIAEAMEKMVQQTGALVNVVSRIERILNAAFPAAAGLENHE